MIPTRQRVESPSARGESVQHKLARLRNEARRQERNLQPPVTTSHRHQDHTTTTSLTTLLNRWNLSHDSYHHDNLATMTTTVRPSSAMAATVGPPAPRSWLVNDQDATTSMPTKVLVQGGVSVPKHILLKPLASRDQQQNEQTRQPRNGSSTSVASLFDIAGQVVAQDLKLSARKSLLLPFVHYLPAHVRLKLFDVAAMSWPLECRAIVELVKGEDERGGGDEDEDGGNSPVSEFSGGEDWDLGQARSDLLGSLPMSTILTSLNLAFSSITTSQLRSLLITDVKSSRSIAQFHNLSCLNLAGTTNVSFNESLFATLSIIISLRHLSLAGMKTANGLPVAQVLPRLAIATPSLISLDLSFTVWAAVNGDDWTSFVSQVDWTKRWLGLDMLGLRNVETMSTTSQTSLKDSCKKTIRQNILEQRSQSKIKRKRAWLDIVMT
ncbi:hypothetical protein OIO90_003023 [Microbotryomycetes sp. JL221]|nr:hypothetical protein OIO90_003023 [Microbotryomycetes sp. JL221]